MSGHNQDREERIRKGFEKILNSHGYGFQYRIIELVSQLRRQDDPLSAWLFEVAEFPVNIGAGTRIDFILKRSRRNDVEDKRPFYLLSECKRANPALSNWCFIRVPYTKLTGYANCLILEAARLDETNRLTAAARVIPHTQEQFYEIAIEVKSDEKGDPNGEGRGVIEKASTQVLQGLNGMINFLKSHIYLMGEHRSAFFLPVIFTTAKLWVSNADLRSTDLLTGELDISQSEFKSEPWVFYQYHQSPGLKHFASPEEQPQKLGEIMESEYVRTIAIVNAEGIENFLIWSSHLDIA
ncbi:MAG TPA: hypothetical protein VF543_03165 [Pyrinomonadaceae bacterium]|jgi:hypothetical protein